jgi:hypothetical protein
VIYHDSYWYPRHANRQMREVLHSDWGRLFANWEKLTPNEIGWPNVGADPAGHMSGAWRTLGKSLGILGTCVKEAPEFNTRKRHAASAAH